MRLEKYLVDNIDMISRVTHLAKSCHPHDAPKLVDYICELLELIGAFGNMTKADLREAVELNVRQWKRGAEAMRIAATREAA